MLIEQLWTANAYRNFNYLIACPETGEALAIDPLDHRQCLATAKRNGWRITQIFNTHEHGDHTGGNEAIIAQTKGKLLAHHKARDKIRGIDEGLAAGDTVKVGNGVALKVLDTPGHTMSHLCLFAPSNPPALFCGDTLFNAGAGNCHNGGDPNALYATFTQQLALLPCNTRIYPGHEYIENNLGFTLDREPDNEQAMALLAEVKSQDPNHAFVSTLALEKEINTFFRLDNPTLITKLRETFPDLPRVPDPKTVFLKLRELRNKW
ncbi:Hydroxyacylglutathione hydrolase [Nitrosococcus oceani ATCC 19707]|uniref:Hydroxyacylglutathione hydrolase n=2 Tax=Nitrosococcus oceani TaxID=1229 RepID=GLO2_NITOC|nr:hydroxyacylglutathione hydrolase [Nitrosococcus oceani]Q3JAC4.1 RecName: Full=Hydroxyacylglutathione hydrolase; AltName: Full=Glyoxalase II; Short=Glx II [Nitrosococcus oceani ATCC 19707]KFI19336.1 hydroxyacylglutathione hydrolase [Nitrosococcus oceani C-27]ABA58222.1 Hydroxyacylglutathione hydrolase [Nitrosococcus oceani ATCC 19707]EDZ67461.1 metallo-beta-lactamase superfamily protein [Nitrosococcus oceani AFC27]GEM20442.1 hydroxyacylglutathione hydrolase [Nitrosococcus oceani]